MRTIKIKFIFVLFIAFMIFSCKARKKPNSDEQDKNVEENIETSEVYIYLGEKEETTGNIKLDDVKAKLFKKYAGMEDIYKTLGNWNVVDTNYFDEKLIKRIIYGNGKFLVACERYVPLVYSDDGETWHEAQNDLLKGGIDAMAYGRSRFVAVIKYGAQIACSNDGITWRAAKTGGFDHSSIDNISYGNGCFVAVGYNRDQENGIIWYSDDGDTWTIAENGSLNIKIFNCIAYGNGMFIAGGGEGKAAYSIDGKTWAVMPGSPFENIDVRNIVFGNGRFVAYCNYFHGYDPKTFYSDNGMDWTLVSKPPLYPRIAYGNGIFISVCDRLGEISFSIDGYTWYPGPSELVRFIGALRYMEGIAYGNGRFVAGSQAYIAWCEMPDIFNDTEDDEGNEVNNFSGE